MPKVSKWKSQYLHMSYWWGWPQKSPKHCSLLTRAIYFKILFLKASHTSAAGHQELKLDLGWQFPVCWLSFTEPKDVSKLLHVKQVILVLLSCGNHELPWHPSLQDISSSASDMNIMEIFNVFPSPHEGNHSWYSKYDQEPMAGRSWAFVENLLLMFW